MKLIESTFVKSQGYVSSLKVKWRTGCCLQIQQRSQNIQWNRV